jgi:transcriptional regulator with XRE-family HTH domain
MLSGMDLKIKRTIQGIQAKEIAKLLGVSQAFVTYMEKEKKKIPQDKYIVWVQFLRCND